MDADHDTTIEGRVARVNADFQKRQAKFFLRFAITEASLLVVGVLVVYVFKLVDPQVGLGILIGIVVVCGLALTTWMLRTVKARAEAVQQARGGSDLTR